MTQDLKVYALSIGTFGISMSNIDIFLKVMLMVVTIGYTIQKWYLMNKNEENK
jgi:hypothetical protein